MSAGRRSPLATACERVRLVSQTAWSEISTFSRSVRAARQGLHLVTREIASLDLTIDAVEHDVSNLRDSLPAEEQLCLVLQQCEIILEQLRFTLQDLRSDGSRKDLWTPGRDEVARLRTSLERQRCILEMKFNLAEFSAQVTGDDYVNAPDASRDDISEATTEVSKLSLAELPANEEPLPPRPSSGSPHTANRMDCHASSQFTRTTPSLITLTSCRSRHLPEKLPFHKHSKSQADLRDMDEDLFDLFFVDSDAGPKVLTKYIPIAEIKGLLDDGADPNTSRRGRNLVGQPEHLGPGGINLANSPVLTLAAAVGDHGILEKLLDCGAKSNVSKGDAGSALHAAAMFDQRRCVQLLLARSADPNTQGGVYGYPVIAATGKAGSQVLKAILNAGADPNVTFKRFGAPLHVAASNISESRERVRLLLDAGAHPGTYHRECGTPLLCACYSDNQETVNILLQAGADPNMAHDQLGAPLLVAVHRGQLPTAKLLMEFGANKQVIACLQDYDDEIRSHDLLSAAVSSRRPEVVQWVLQSGFGTSDYWKSGAFKDSLAILPRSKDLGKLKIYSMIYNHARQRGLSMRRQKPNALLSILAPLTPRGVAEQ